MFHNREYLVAIRPLDDVLVLHTMRFADELVDPGRFDFPNPSRPPTEREVELARMLVDSILKPFRAAEFRDTYRERVLALIASKGKGEEPELRQIEEPSEPPDLLAALEASLSKSGSGRGLASTPAPQQTGSRRGRARTRR